MRSVRDAFLDFQLTTLFDKNISALRRVTDTSEILDAYPVILLNQGSICYLRKPRRSINAR